MQRAKSRKLFNKTKKMIPGGVNSPVRSFSAVSGCHICFINATTFEGNTSGYYGDVP